MVVLEADPHLRTELLFISTEGAAYNGPPPP